MDDSKLAVLASQTPLDPLKSDPASVILSSQHLGCNGIIFWWRQAPPTERHLPPLTKHLVVFQLQASSRLIQVRDGRQHEGPWHRGDVLVMPAGRPSLWCTEGSNNLHIALEPCFVQRVALEACDMEPDRVELLDVFHTRDVILRSIARVLWSELKAGCVGGQLCAESLGNVLAVHLLRNYCTQRPVLRFYKGGLPQHQLRRVVDYINAYLVRQVTLSELAGLLQMSEAHFIRAFRESMGCTPHHYVIKCRIEQAKALLSDPTVSIGTIASRVGFQTHSHFTVLFRKLTALSPTAYRNQWLTRPAPGAIPDDAQQV